MTVPTWQDIAAGWQRDICKVWALTTSAHLGGEGVLGQAVRGVHVEQVHLAGGQRWVLLHPGLPPHVPSVQDGLHTGQCFVYQAILWFAAAQSFSCV